MKPSQHSKKGLTLPAQLNFNPDLPITGRKEDIVQAIQQHPVVIVSGATGSGKTTQIPKFCIAAGRGASGMIGCTQPRRIAAINVAKRIAEELGEPLGRSVGYKIRFDDKTTHTSCIKLMTDGILLAEAQADRFLTAYDTIIVDEAHERSLNIDFALGLLRQLIGKRPDLKLVITSATIDTEKFSAAFDGAPVIEVSGRMFPVETVYQPLLSMEDDKPSMEDQGYVEAAADAVTQLLTQTRTGDILVFMPTEQDIGETMELIRGKKPAGATLLPLFARLSAREQAKIFSTQVGRKIIVSTNVAETSLTIPGIKYVVDTGLARIPRYSPRTRTTALPVSPISQSSANQRLGRCGRVENGICIRLFDEEDYQSRPLFTAPEILRSNLAEVILKMIFLNLGDVKTFPFIDPPAPKSIKDGFDSLVELGAIKPVKVTGKKKKKSSRTDRYALTPTGRLMARLPLDPKLSRILIEADRNGCLNEAVIITTALAISDPRQRPADKTQAADQKHAGFKDPTSDFITILNIWQAYKAAEKKLKSRSRLKQYCQDHFLSFKRIREWTDIHGQVSRLLKEQGIKGKDPLCLPTGTKGMKSKAFDIGGPLYIALHKSLLSGYLAHIAHKKEKNIFTAAKGQQAMIFPGSGLFSSAGNWIVAAEFVQTSQVFARTVANIDPEWVEALAKPLCTRTWSDPHWEKKRGQVMAKEQVSLFGLILVSDRPVAYGTINPEEACEIFIRQALVQGQVFTPFEFMVHNQQLIDELETLEDKTRTKGILVSEDEIFLFYRSRLPKPFFSVHSFSRFLKEQKNQDFLKMTLADLQQSPVAPDTLARYPDTLTMKDARFKLAYEFNPGAKTDGVTIAVPASAAALVEPGNLDRLVPGFFKEKIIALIKALPKKYRVNLVPVSEKADIIADQIQLDNTPLYRQLSAFIHQRFGVLIPATQWSDQSLPDHLKMRISIQDDSGREILSARKPDILQAFSSAAPSGNDDAFHQARKKHEKSPVLTWDFGDLPDAIVVRQDKTFTQNAYPGLKIDTAAGQKTGSRVLLSLCLFKTREEALACHEKGVHHLYTLCFPHEFKALKKDINTHTEIRKLAPFFSGQTRFQTDLYDQITHQVFAKNIRTQQAFDAHAQKEIKQLYHTGQAYIATILELGRAYTSCFETIQKLSFAHQDKPRTFAILSGLFTDLKNLVPPHFPGLYSLERTAQLHRYVDGIRIRAQRAVEAPLKAEQKAEQVNGYIAHLDRLLASLSNRSSPEKASEVESFFWLLEEYKISVFAQELKTRTKVSAKKLDQALLKISAMI